MLIDRSKDINQYIYVIAFSLLVSACGSGSGNKEPNNLTGENNVVEESSINNDSSSLPDVFEPEVSEPDVSDPGVAVTVATSTLITTGVFELNSTSVIDVSINLPELNYKRAYLNICHKNDLGDIDYKNCLINRPLKDGKLDLSLEIGNQVDMLHMEIWHYDVTSEPFAMIWDKQSGNTWDVFSDSSPFR